MENTAKNFALQLGALISLYISLGSLISLIFGLITIGFPSQADMYWEVESATAAIRTSIAILVVFFPTYIALTRIVNTIRRKEQGTYLGLTKWLIYLSLLIGGGVLLGDLVTILLSFLNGELTIRFALKALTVFLVVASAFVYYVLDVRGYWQSHEKNSLLYAAAISLVVVIALGFGLTHIETPSEIRERNIDARQISDLQEIQNQVQNYTTLHGEVPQTLQDAFLRLTIPEAPENRSAYTYQKISASQFELCASFAQESRESYGYEAYPVTEKYMIKNAYTWDHAAGDWCFKRAVNLE